MIHNRTTCSLLITTYNWPEALEKSIESAFQQKTAPNEILIADDGSDDRTKRLIEKMAVKTNIPIRHIWQEDIGFRLSEIRNKAIAAAKYDYIIQIDGDIIMEKHFIQDHLTMAQSKTFLCGSRVLLSPNISQTLLEQKISSFSFKHMPLGFILNSFRIPFIANLMADRYKQKKTTALRGCNMSFWRKDLLSVNGYNEGIKGWGSEDAELAIRLVNAGIKKRALKFMGIAFHIYHQENSRANSIQNEQLLANSIQKKTIRIHNGIQKYVQ